MAISLDENQQPVDQVENTPIGVDPLEPTSTPLQMPDQEVLTEEDAFATDNIEDLNFLKPVVDTENKKTKKGIKVTKENEPLVYNLNGKDFSERTLSATSLGSNFKDSKGKNNKVSFRYNGNIVNKIPETVEEFIAWHKYSGSKVSTRSYNNNDKEEDAIKNYSDEFDRGFVLDDVVFNIGSDTSKYLKAAGIGIFDEQSVEGWLPLSSRKSDKLTALRIDLSFGNTGAGIINTFDDGGTDKDIEWNEEKNSYVWKEDADSPEDAVFASGYKTGHKKGDLVTNENYNHYRATIQKRGFINENKNQWNLKHSVIDLGDNTLTEEDYENYNVISINELRNKRIKSDATIYHNDQLKKNGYQKTLDNTIEYGKRFLSTEEKELNEYETLVNKKIKNLPQGKERKDLLDSLEEKRKKENIGGRLYDPNTGTLLSLEKSKNASVQVIQFNEKVEEKTITGVDELQEQLVKAMHNLQSFAGIAHDYIKNNNKSIEVKERRTVFERIFDFVGDAAQGDNNPYYEITSGNMDEGTGYKSDLKNLFRLSKGRMPGTLTNMSGDHNIAKTYNKLLDEYLVLNRALQLNSDPIKQEKESNWNAFVGGTISALGAGSLATGSKRQIEGIESFVSSVQNAGFEYKKEDRKPGSFAGEDTIGNKESFTNLQLDHMTQENTAQIVFGGFPELTRFVGEIIVYNSLTGGSFGLAKGLGKGSTMISSALKAKGLPPKALGLFNSTSKIINKTAAGYVEFAGADLMFDRITKHHSDPYSSGKSGALLGFSHSAADQFLKLLPASKFFSPIMGQLAKSKAFLNFQKSTTGAAIGTFSFHSAGVLQPLLEGESWNEATKGLTAKSVFGEFFKLKMLGAKNILSKQGIAHAIRQDYLNFNGQTVGSKKGARFFEIDHKEIVETGNVEAFEKTVNDKKLKLKNKLKNKDIDQQTFDKELKIIESNRVNVENAIYLNLGKKMINAERGKEGGQANDRVPTDANIYLLVNKLKRGKELDLQETEHLANTPEGILLARSGFTVNSPQGKRLLLEKKIAEYTESILDNGQYKTARGTSGRLKAFEFLKDQFAAETKVENLSKQLKDFKQKNPDNKTGIEKLQAELLEAKNEFSEYSKEGSKNIELQKVIKKEVVKAIEKDLTEGKKREEKLGGKLIVSETAKDFQIEYNKRNKDGQDVTNKVAMIIGNARVVNKEAAIRYRNLNPSKHEDIHFILKDVFKELNEAGEKVVTNEGMKIIDNALAQLTPSQRKIVQKRIDDNYRFDEKGKEKDPNEYYEEYLTALSDAITNKTIQFTDKFSKSLFPIVDLLKNKGFENLEINKNTGKNLFELIKTFTEKGTTPTEQDILKLPKTKVSDKTVDFSKETTLSKVEREIVDNKNTKLITKYQSGNKNKIETLEKIKLSLKNQGKTTFNVQKEIDALKQTKVDASVLPELMKNNIGLVKTFENQFDSKKGGDVKGARQEVRTQIENLFSTYKPTLDNGKTNPVKFGGYAIPIMKVRMANIYDKYSVKFKENVSLESKEVLGMEGSIGGKRGNKGVETGKINPLDFVKNSEINVTENLQKEFDKGIDLQGISSKKLGDISKETTAAIFNIPVGKLVPRENVTFKDVIVTSKMMSNKKFRQENPDAFEGQLIKSEASKIQDKIVSFGSDFMKLLPKENVAPMTASELIKGTSIGIEPSILKAFYEKVLKPDGNQKRSSGKTSQVGMWKLKQQFTDVSGYNEFLKIIGKEKGKSSEFNRDIGQILKSLANMYGRMNSNTFVRTKLQGVEIASVINDIAAGNSKAQFSSEASFNRYKEIQDKYKLNSVEFKKAIENPSEVKDLELRAEVTQANFNSVKATEYAVREVNKNFEKKYKEERINNPEFDVNFAFRSGLSVKEAKTALDIIQNSSASFESTVNGKKVFNKENAKDFVKSWTDFYNFMGRGGIEMGTKQKNGLTGVQLEQLFFIGERTTFISKEGKYDLGPGGLVGKSSSPGIFTLNPSGKVSLKNNPNFSIRTLNLLKKIDFSSLNAQNIASQDKLRNTILKGESVESVIESLRKQITPKATQSLNDFNLFLESAKTDYIDSKKNKGQDFVDAAQFLYTSSRMNSNLVKGVRGTYANKYFYVTEGNQGMTMENPIYKGAYNEAIATATNNPKVLTTVSKGIEKTFTIEEYAQRKAKDAAKLKGEHVNDTSTGQLNGWLAQVTGKGGTRVDGINVKDLIQIASPKKFLDIIDKALGTNAEGGLFRMLGDPAIVKVLKNFIDPNGPNLYNVLQKEAAKQVSKNPALADYILNNKFTATDKSKSILEAKQNNIKNTKLVHVNLVKTAKKAGIFSSEKKFSNEELINKIKDLDNKNKKSIRESYNSKDLNKDFNDIIQDRTGVEAFKTFSTAKASIQGKKKGNWDFYVRPAAEDFTGLIYKTLPKGKKGNDAMKWYQENLIDPFTRGDKATANERMSVLNDYKAVVKQIKDIPKTLKKQAAEGFTNEQAVRVYNWSKQDVKIPGISAKDAIKLTKAVENNAELKAFAEQIVELNKGDGYPKPGENWLTGTITTDLMAGIGKVKRKKHMEQFINNVDAIYTPENLNKLESQFGRSYRDALENMLYRMKTGSNRPKSLGKIESAALEWINGSVGVTMFFNTRSAALQLLSIPNYINLKDNNPFKAGAKFANQKQFWGDFMTLMNSNWAVSRRNGIKLNVTESEIAEAAARSGNKAQGAINYMLEKGFIFTKYADGFATAFGGSTMYRNRIETYKKEGFSEKEAKEKAMKDWEEISETTQQSGRTDKISQEQASLGGRLVLAFGNTGMQYTRIPKRAVQDLVNRRISPGSKTQFESDATNVSKAVYYSTITSALFVGLQNALFEAAFNPDADIDDKKVRAAENMVDNALRGTGMYGAALSTMRSVASKLYKESQDKRPEYVEAAWETLNVSPPIDIKVSKFKSAFRSLQYDMEEMKEKGALNPTNPAYLASAQVISGVTNLPLDRLFRKVDNLNSALQENRDTWQRIALIGGYSDYELGIEKDKKSKTFDNKRIFDRPNTRKKIIGIPKRKKIF